MARGLEVQYCTTVLEFDGIEIGSVRGGTQRIPGYGELSDTVRPRHGSVSGSLTTTDGKVLVVSGNERPIGVDERLKLRHTRG